MISMTELLHGHDWNSLTQEQQHNLGVLLNRMNQVRQLYGKPMTITSGVRTMEDQIRIDTAAGRKKITQKSAHLLGAACDVWDRDKLLWGWVMDNLALMEHFGLWMEDKSRTPTWVHFQIYAPASGNRIFMPY